MSTTQSDPPVADQSADQAPELDRLGRRRHAGQFKPGQSGNPSGKRKEPPPDEEWQDDGLTTLRRFQRVFSQPKSRDRGPAEANLRRLLEEDRGKYVTQLVALERAEAAAAAAKEQLATPEDGKPPPDEPTARVIALAEQLLADLAVKHGAHAG